MCRPRKRCRSRMLTGLRTCFCGCTPPRERGCTTDEQCGVKAESEEAKRVSEYIVRDDHYRVVVGYDPERRSYFGEVTVGGRGEPRVRLGAADDVRRTLNDVAQAVSPWADVPLEIYDTLRACDPEFAELATLA